MEFQFPNGNFIHAFHRTIIVFQYFYPKYSRNRLLLFFSLEAWSLISTPENINFTVQILKVSHYKTTPLEMDGNIGLHYIPAWLYIKYPSTRYITNPSATLFPVLKNVFKVLVNFQGADSVLCELFYQDVTTTCFYNT